MLTRIPRMFGRKTLRPRPSWFLALAVVAIGADPYRPAPKFTGRTIPAPPLQGSPWKPPETPLPRFLVDASAALFEAGLPDPRGCDYREVDLAAGGLVKTHAFVLPERPGVDGRFAVAWDGLIYPAATVGAPADLDADVRALADIIRKGRDRAPDEFASWGRFGVGYVEDPSNLGFAKPSPLKICLLLRLGRAELAEALFAAGTTWTRDTPRRDLTDYRINLVSLARGWASGAYNRLVNAHERGEDGVALDLARRLSRFVATIDAKAAALGFSRQEAGYSSRRSASYFGGLDELPALLADHERRAAEPARGPIPPRGGDPAARVAALIHDFDQIHEVQMSIPGGAYPGQAGIVQEVVDEGDAAVEPLLQALEADTRLTRSVSRRSDWSHVEPVVDAVGSALQKLLKTQEFAAQGLPFPSAKSPEERRKLAANIRAYWEKNRAVPLAERWYRDLRDDSAGGDRWMQAAVGLASPVTPQGFRRPGAPLEGRPALQGDPLRDRRDPSISDLMARRARDLAASSPGSIPDRGLEDACALGLAFARWDEQASLPTLKALMTQCRERAIRAFQGHPSQHSYARQITPLALIRARAGDEGALDEFVDWARRVDPKTFDYQAIQTLEPMWSHPDRPEVVEAARSMFLDPKSRWLPLIPTEPGRNPLSTDDLVCSPLLVLAPFREAVLAALADRTPVGTARREAVDRIHFKLTSGASGSYSGTYHADPTDPPGIERTIRVCDLAAWKLSAIEGAPAIELSWADDRRDAAVAGAIAYLRLYGPRLSAEPFPDDHDFPRPRAHLRFPILDRAATAEDVREGRAIFSLEGEGETRLAAPKSGLPILARRVPPEAPGGGPLPVENPSRLSRAWQAEEVRRGDRWERFYGLVGPGTIARVPAAEVLFPSGRGYGMPPLTRGLDPQIRLDRPEGPEIPAGRPIPVTLAIRNASGLDREVSADFVRRAEGGKPALRRGVVPRLFAAPPGEAEAEGHPFGRAGLGFVGGDEVPPGPIDRFEPGDPAKALAPTEAFDAMTVDLNDWYPGLKPGRYRFELTFAGDSGLGEGKTGPVYFRIR